MRYSINATKFLSILWMLQLFGCEPPASSGEADHGTDDGTSHGTDVGTDDGTDDGTNHGTDDGTAGEYCGTLADTSSIASEKYADEFCCLCKDCFLGPDDRGSTVLKPDGLTCNMLSLEMTDPSNASKPGSAVCRDLQSQYRETCCNPDCTPRPVEQVFDPVDPPLPQGNQPWCDLCYPYDLPNGQFPLKPYTITAVLGIPGNPTCQDLYWMGRTGNMEDRLCYPLQDYMEEPCGCLPPGPPDYPQGNEPWCDICPAGQYPLRPDTHPAGLSIANKPSCQDLYWMGRTGNLSGPMCHQLQADMQDDCGCLPAK